MIPMAHYLHLDLCKKNIDTFLARAHKTTAWLYVVSQVGRWCEVASR